MVDGKDVERLQRYVNLPAYGRDLLEQDNAVITPYGRMDRDDFQPMITMVVLGRRSRKALAGNRAEGYIDTAIKILIAVVLGGLLLAGLYSLFGDTVLPTLVDRIKEMFNYAG